MKSIINFSLRLSAAIIVCLLSAVVLESCSASKGKESTPKSSSESLYRYKPFTDFSNDILTTATKDISIRRPNNWNEVVDEKNAPNIILWIVKDDNTASLSFIALVMDPTLYKSLSRDGLRAVANVSMSMKRDRMKDSMQVISPLELFHVNNKEYYAYEYSFDKGKTIVRIVIFDTGKQFVECAALPAVDNFTSEQTKELFTVQQGLLYSMSIK